MFNRLSITTIFITAIVILTSAVVGAGLPAMGATPEEIGFLPGGQTAYQTRVAGTSTALSMETRSSTSRAVFAVATATPRQRESEEGPSPTPSATASRSTPTMQPTAAVETAAATTVVVVEPSPTATATAAPTETATVENTPTMEPSPTATVAATGQITVLAEALNVRSGPGMSYPVIRELRGGDVATAVAMNPAREWVKILLPEGPAWVGAAFVQLVTDQELPVEAVP